MKRTMLLIGLFLLLGSPEKAKSSPALEGRFEIFYSSLSPYGEWVDCGFGRAWRPMHVMHGWRPYLTGRWAWTDYGWYWVSYEPFGWATYHYGRWYLDDYYGWIWIPGDMWGPSWVEWRYDDDYIGWAPLPPYAEYRMGFGIYFSMNWVAPAHYWNFIGSRNFTSYHVDEYVQPSERNDRIFGHTRGALNIRSDGDRVINRGLELKDIERRTRSRVDRIDVVAQQDRRGERIVNERNRERIEVYQPRIEGRTPTDVRPSAPRDNPRELYTPARPDRPAVSEPPARSREPVRRDDARTPQLGTPNRERSPQLIPRQPTEKRLERPQAPSQQWRTKEPQKLPRQPSKGVERPRTEPRPRGRR